jgi:hypothetical protein
MVSMRIPRNVSICLRTGVFFCLLSSHLVPQSFHCGPYLRTVFMPALLCLFTRDESGVGSLAGWAFPYPSSLPTRRRVQGTWDSPHRWQNDICLTYEGLGTDLKDDNMTSAFTSHTQSSPKIAFLSYFYPYPFGVFCPHLPHYQRYSLLCLSSYKGSSFFFYNQTFLLFLAWGLRIVPGGTGMGDMRIPGSLTNRRGPIESSRGK